MTDCWTDGLAQAPKHHLVIIVFVPCHETQVGMYNGAGTRQPV